MPNSAHREYFWEQGVVQIMFSGAHELSPERLAVVFVAVLILLVWQEAVDVLPDAA